MESVARSHVCETLAFSLVFGSLLGWLLNCPPSPVSYEAAATQFCGTSRGGEETAHGAVR